ncbi:MAG: sel1 repeat family protein [Enterobacterales bacterium]|nr:sel1 repeat family protein [Enterobacterales bacterium]
MSSCTTLKDAYESTFTETEISSGDKLDSDDLNTLISQPYIDPLTRFILRHKDNTDRSRQVEVAYTELQSRCNQATSRFEMSNPNAADLTRFIRAYKFSCPVQVSRLQTEAENNESTADTTRTTIRATNQSTLTENEAKQTSDCYLLLSINNYTEAKTMCQPLIEQGDLAAIEGIAEVVYLEEDYAYFLVLAEPVANESATLSYLMGKMYELGNGVAISLESAKNWYLSAQELGHPEAQLALYYLESQKSNPQ